METLRAAGKPLFSARLLLKLENPRMFFCLNCFPKVYLNINFQGRTCIQPSLLRRPEGSGWWQNRKLQLQFRPQRFGWKSCINDHDSWNRLQPFIQWRRRRRQPSCTEGPDYFPNPPFFLSVPLSKNVAPATNSNTHQDFHPPITGENEFRSSWTTLLGISVQG